MAELATDRPAVRRGPDRRRAANGNAAGLAAEVDAFADDRRNAQVRQFADNPKVTRCAGVRACSTGVARTPPVTRSATRRRTCCDVVIDNGRLAALPEIAVQFQALSTGRAASRRRPIESAFPIERPQVAEVQAAIEKRFGRKLEHGASSSIPELIGGVRVHVGDEVLDTSIRARLEQMKAALTAAEVQRAARHTSRDLALPEFQPACRSADRSPTCN